MDYQYQRFRPRGNGYSYNDGYDYDYDYDYDYYDYDEYESTPSYRLNPRPSSSIPPEYGPSPKKLCPTDWCSSYQNGSGPGSLPPNVTRSRYAWPKEAYSENEGYNASQFYTYKAMYQQAEDPVAKAVYHNIMRTSQSQSFRQLRKKANYCELCGLELMSRIAYNAHINGGKHARRLKELEICEKLKEWNDEFIKECPDTNGFKCILCDVVLSSYMPIQSHIEGTKHTLKLENTSKNKLKRILEEYDAPEYTIEPPVIEMVPNKSNKNFFCDVCELSLNSKVQYDQHMGSPRHALKMAYKVQSPEGMALIKARKAVKRKSETTSNCGLGTALDWRGDMAATSDLGQNY